MASRGTQAAVSPSPVTPAGHSADLNSARAKAKTPITHAVGAPLKAENLKLQHMQKVEMNSNARQKGRNDSHGPLRGAETRSNIARTNASGHDSYTVRGDQMFASDNMHVNTYGAESHRSHRSHRSNLRSARSYGSRKSSRRALSRRSSKNLS